MRITFLNEDNEIASAEQPVGIAESQLSGAAKEKQIGNDQEKKSLKVKAKGRIKNRVKNYIHNLDPRGKDKFWWTGNLLSTGVSAGLLLTSPAALPFKSLVSATASIGVYAFEKSTEKYQKMKLSDEEFAERTAKRQEKFPNGTSRMRRFFLGVSAGSIYGAALGVPLEATGVVNYHPIKNLERRVDAAKREI